MSGDTCQSYVRKVEITTTGRIVITQLWHVNCALNAWNTQKSANHIGLLDLYKES